MHILGVSKTYETGWTTGRQCWNGYFSSAFTREDIISLPVPDAKFQEANLDYLGQLIVTPEMVAKKIKAMNDNKSPGVDGIPPKLVMEQ